MNSPKHNGGYLRIKIYNQSLIVAGLIDSGNISNETLISESLCKTLKLKITPKLEKLGTAAGGHSVTTLGRTQPISIFLEGLDRPFEIKPLVVKSLSHHINLGTSFLAENEAELKFSKNKNPILKIKGHKLPLKLGKNVMSHPTKDDRFAQVIKQFLLENPMVELSKRSIIDLNLPYDKEPCGLPGVCMTDSREWHGKVFSEELINVYNQKRIVASPNAITVIKCKYNGIQGKKGPETLLFMPIPNNQALNKRKLLPLSGLITSNGKRECFINILNLGIKPIKIDIGTKIGQICHQIEENDLAINVLDHREVKDLGPKDLEERRNYIIESLKLKEKAWLKDRPDLQEQVINIFLKNWGAVSLSSEDIGSIPRELVECKLNLKEGATPCKARVIQLNPAMENELRKQVDGWLDSQVIEPCISEWSSAIFPVQKKVPKGHPPQYRFVINYKNLNEKLVGESYPLPSIECNLQRLGHCQIFSCLDSVSAYSAIKMAPESRDFTTFSCVLGTFRYKRMPFGLACAPAVYQRLVQRALTMLPQSWLYTLSYLDDLIIFSKNEEEHIKHLDTVISLQSKIGLKLNLAKCHLFEKEVVYLGYLISKAGIGMIPEYVEKILNWPLPTTSKELASFLGFTGYYQRSIKDYGKLTYNLNNLRNQVGKITLPEEAKKDFEELKKCFSERPIRAFPDWESPNPFILDIDYSSQNMAAVLSQVQDDQERILGCVAKKCSKTEQAYSSFKGELGSLILGLKKFEHLLRMRKFLIRTDSNSLATLRRMKEPRGIFTRWQCYLDSFDYQIQHRAGSKNQNADGLSRMPGLLTKGPENFDPFDLDHQMVDEIYSLEQNNEYENVLKNDLVLQEIIKMITNNQEVTKDIRKKMNIRGQTLLRYFQWLKVDKGKLYISLPTWKDSKLVPPIGLYNQIFELSHVNKVMGHGGIQETISQISKRYYFPHMPTYVTARINNCIGCLSKKLKVDKIKHKMYTQELGYFNQVIFSDFVGPLHTVSYNGQRVKHVLTLMDGYTRYMVCVPVPDLETKTLAQAIIRNWILHYGIPQQIHSDNGSSYTSKLFQDIMEGLGIKHSKTPIYSPQGNRIERHHQTIFQTIRCNDEFKKGQWPANLQIAVFAHNIRKNTITGYSPFYLLHGYHPILPLDLMYPELKPADNAVERLFQGYEELYKIVSKNQGKYQSLIQLNKGIPKLEENDMVYYFYNRVTNKNISPKLQSRYIGPFKITKKLSDHLFLIYPQGSWSKNPREICCIANRLRKIQSQLESTDIFDLDQVKDNEALETEFILGNSDGKIPDDKTEQVAKHKLNKDIQDLESTESHIEDLIFGSDDGIGSEVEKLPSLPETDADTSEKINLPIQSSPSNRLPSPNRIVTRSMTKSQAI